jgi:hypothetical protein
VSARHTDIVIERTSIGEGAYIIDALPATGWTIRAEADGFDAHEVRDVTLPVDDFVHVSFFLKPAPMRSWTKWWIDWSVYPSQGNLVIEQSVWNGNGGRVVIRNNSMFHMALSGWNGRTLLRVKSKLPALPWKREVAYDPDAHGLLQRPGGYIVLEWPAADVAELKNGDHINASTFPGKRPDYMQSGRTVKFWR